jgi:hypothetical protein
MRHLRRPVEYVHLSPPIMRTQRFASAILVALTLACSAPGLAESSPPKGVDAEVVTLASRGLLP